MSGKPVSKCVEVVVGRIGVLNYQSRVSEGTRPKKNAFAYKLCYVTISHDEFRRGKKSALFSVDRANVFSLRSKDYGDGCAEPATWVRIQKCKARISFQRDAVMPIQSGPRTKILVTGTRDRLR